MPPASPEGHGTRKGASHIFWLGGYGAEIPPIDDFGSSAAFEAAFDGEQGVGIGLQPTTSRLTKKMGCTQRETEALNDRPMEWTPLSAASGSMMSE